MRTSFNIPDDLLTKFDHTWEHEGLDSRSRAVRESMREYIETHTRLEDVSGEVTTLLAFDYEASAGEFHDIQDSFKDVITATTHSNEGSWDLQTVFCRGDAARIRELVYQLRDVETIARVKVLILTPHESHCHHTHTDRAHADRIG